MSQSEVLVRLVLGSFRKGTRPFVCAIECVIRHSFAIDYPIEDIQVTKVIYPEVAKLLNMRPGAAARQIERIANDCWDRGDRERLNEIFGRELPVCPPPRDMIFYFAAYAYYGQSFRQVMKRQYAMMP